MPKKLATCEICGIACQIGFIARRTERSSQLPQEFLISCLDIYNSGSSEIIHKLAWDSGHAPLHRPPYKNSTRPWLLDPDYKILIPSQTKHLTFSLVHILRRYFERLSNRTKKAIARWNCGLRNHSEIPARK